MPLDCRPPIPTALIPACLPAQGGNGGADAQVAKGINDRFGYPSGDAVLRHVSDTCSGLLRESDLMGRIGGEEFAILLPQTPSNRPGRLPADCAWRLPTGANMQQMAAVQRHPCRSAWPPPPLRWRAAPSTASSAGPTVRSTTPKRPGATAGAAAVNHRSDRLRHGATHELTPHGSDRR